MSSIPAMQAALAGLRANLEIFERTAARLAAQAPEGDLATPMVDLITSQRGFQANAVTVRTADDLTGTLLDLLR